jgi:hypothetical protein
MAGKSLFRNNSAVGATYGSPVLSARGKNDKAVSRHHKQVVEMLNVFGAKTSKCFKSDFPGPQGSIRSFGVKLFMHLIITLPAAADSDVKQTKKQVDTNELS